MVALFARKSKERKPEILPRNPSHLPIDNLSASFLSRQRVGAKGERWVKWIDRVKRRFNVLLQLIGERQQASLPPPDQLIEEAQPDTDWHFNQLRFQLAEPITRVQKQPFAVPPR